MNWYEALIFGLVQGLTEFLPVSSDGHLEIVKYIFGGIEESFLFSVAVHGATVLSIIVVFWKEIVKLLQGVFKFRMNEETIYAMKIVVSMIPVAIVGFTLKDFVEFSFHCQYADNRLIFTCHGSLPGLWSFCKKEKQGDFILGSISDGNCAGTGCVTRLVEIRIDYLNRTCAWI